MINRTTSQDDCTTLTDTENWRLVREESLTGPMCMALDAVAAETAAAGGPRTVRVYQWDPSTLSLGYHQKHEDIDWAFCERENITVTRRPTGGGAIYHDRDGDISYSIVAPADELPSDLMDTYELLCQPLLDACSSMDVPADFADETVRALHEPACYLRGIHPAHDVVYAGQKLSGNAQYRRRDSIIQHGSLTYSATPEPTLGCFVDPDVSTEQASERITGIDEHSDISREEAVQTLEHTLKTWADATEGTWTDDELARAREIAAKKFNAEAWNRDGDDPMTR